MKMFTSISKLQSSWYLSVAFPVKCWLFQNWTTHSWSCIIGLTLLTRFSAFLTDIIVTLVASIAVCIMASIMLCSAAILSFSTKTALHESACFLLSSLSNVRFFPVIPDTM